MELPQKNISSNPVSTHDDEILKHARATHRPISTPIRKTTSPRVLEARGKFVSSLIYSMALLALGGIVTGITYSLADAGSTYTVTTGLFVIGGIYFCFAIWNMLKWLTLKAARK